MSISAEYSSNVYANQPQMFEVRQNGKVLEHAIRIPRKHKNWESVVYKGKRYQLYGGCYVNPFINFDFPIQSRSRNHILKSTPSVDEIRGMEE